MKTAVKKITITMFMVAIATIAIHNINRSRKSTSLADIALENIDALANDLEQDRFYLIVNKSRYTIIEGGREQVVIILDCQEPHPKGSSCS